MDERIGHGVNGNLWRYLDASFSFFVEHALKGIYDFGQGETDGCDISIRQVKEVSA